MKHHIQLALLSLLLLVIFGFTIRAIVAREADRGAQRIPVLRAVDLKTATSVRLEARELTPEEVAARAMLPFLGCAVAVLAIAALREHIRIIRVREVEDRERARIQREKSEWYDLDTACSRFNTATAISRRRISALTDVGQLAGILPLLVEDGSLEPDTALAIERNAERLKISADGRLLTRENDAKRSAYLSSIDRQRACAKYQLIEAFRAMTANDAAAN